MSRVARLHSLRRGWDEWAQASRRALGGVHSSMGPDNVSEDRVHLDRMFGQILSSAVSCPTRRGHPRCRTTLQRHGAEAQHEVL